MNTTTIVGIEWDDPVTVTREAPDEYRIAVESADHDHAVTLWMSLADLRRLHAATADHLDGRP